MYSTPSSVMRRLLMFGESLQEGSINKGEVETYGHRCRSWAGLAWGVNVKRRGRILFLSGQGADPELYSIGANLNLRPKYEILRNLPPGNCQTALCRSCGQDQFISVNEIPYSSLLKTSRFEKAEE